MGVKVASKLGHTLMRSLSGLSLAEGSMLLRLRRASIALLGLVGAVGLGLVLFISQIGWPGVLSGPLPGVSSRVGRVDDAVALRSPGHAVVAARPVGTSVGRVAGGTAHRGVGQSGGSGRHNSVKPAGTGKPSGAAGVHPGQSAAQPTPSQPAANPVPATPTPPPATAPIVESSPSPSTSEPVRTSSEESEAAVAKAVSDSGKSATATATKSQGQKSSKDQSTSSSSTRPSEASSAKAKRDESVAKTKAKAPPPPSPTAEKSVPAPNPAAAKEAADAAKAGQTAH
jgi:hypothetical protein